MVELAITRFRNAATSASRSVPSTNRSTSGCSGASRKNVTP